MVYYIYSYSDKRKDGIKMAIKMMIEDIQVEIKRKPIRDMYVYVKAPDGNVVVSVPENATTTDVRKFILPRIDWIKQKKGKLSARLIALERNYDDGETFFLFGSPLTIKTEHKGTQFAYAEENILHLYLRRGHTKESREKVLREFLRETLYIEIDSMLPELTKLTGVAPSEIQIKDMNTRWSSANTESGKIWINLRLCQMPKDYLRYILLIELGHLKTGAKGAELSRFLDEHMKGWRKIKKDLKARCIEFI